MGSPDVFIRIGETRSLQTGHTVRASRLYLPEEQTQAGPVAKHEIAHVAGSKYKIRRVHIKARGNILGETEPENLTLEATGASEGYGGESGDHFIAAVVFNATPEQAAAAGRAAIAGEEENMGVLAQFLEYRKDMGQTDVNEGLALVGERRRGIYKVAIDVINPDGTQKTYKTKSLNGQVMIPGEWVELDKPFPQAA